MRQSLLFLVAGIALGIGLYQILPETQYAYTVRLSDWDRAATIELQFETGNKTLKVGRYTPEQGLFVRADRGLGRIDAATGELVIEFIAPAGEFVVREQRPDAGLEVVHQESLTGNRVTAEIREAFFRALEGQPQGLKHDIFNHYVQVYYDGPGRAGSFLDAAEGLLPVVDIFHRDFSAEDESLSDAELDFLRTVVDSYAAEIDLELVTDVMNLLLARGRL